MKHILFIIGNLQLGGAETVLVDILNDIYDQFQIDLLLIEKRGEQIKRLSPNINLKYITLGDEYCKNKISLFWNKVYRSMIYRFLGSKKSYVKFIYRKKLRKDYQTEVGFLTGIPTEIIKQSPNKRSKKVMWIHSDIKSASKKFIEQNRHTYPFMDAIVGISKESSEHFIELFPESKSKMIQINNYIDIDKVIEKSNGKNPFRTDKIKALLIGRLTEVKGFERIFEIAPHFPNIEFYIAGWGEKLDQYQAYLKEKNITNVILLGKQENPYLFLKHADMFICSSYSEGYPTVIVEALILNKTIVTTEVAGVREILDGYNNAVIVKNDTKSLEEGIKKVVTKKLFLKKENNCYERINAHNREKIVDLLSEDKKEVII